MKGKIVLLLERCVITIASIILGIKTARCVPLSEFASGVFQCIDGGRTSGQVDVLTVLLVLVNFLPRRRQLATDICRQLATGSLRDNNNTSSAFSNVKFS